MGGFDLKLYDTSLKLIDEFSRNTKENSIKFMIQIKSDMIVLATNSDIEIYGLIPFISNKTNSKENDNDNKEEVSCLTIKELKKYLNVHRDSILTLIKLSGKT